MAYLPFYITPEELQIYQEQQQLDIASGKHCKSWTKYDIEEPNRYYYYLMSLVPILPFVIIFYFLGAGEQDIGKQITLITILLFGFSLSFLTIGLDYRYDYILSETGLLQKKQRAEPKWVNTAAQIAGWIGALVCIIAVGIVGPMALFGAGGLILFSFGMLKRKPDPQADVTVAMRDDWLFALYHKKRKVIMLYHQYDTCEYRDMEHTIVSRNQTRGRSYIFAASIEQLEQLVDIFTNTFQLECTEEPKHQRLFDNADFPKRVRDIPVVGCRYLAEDAMTLRADNAPLPEPVIL